MVDVPVVAASRFKRDICGENVFLVQALEVRLPLEKLSERILFAARENLFGRGKTFESFAWSFLDCFGDFFQIGLDV